MMMLFPMVKLMLVVLESGLKTVVALEALIVLKTCIVLEILEVLLFSGTGCVEGIWGYDASLGDSMPAATDVAAVC